MTQYFDYKIHCRLDFSEVNIVSENRMFRTKDEFINRLTELQSNTSDPVLLRDLQGLLMKVNQLNDDEFAQLIKDADSGVLLFPANYKLPSIIS